MRLIDGWTRQRLLREALSELDEAGIPAGPIYSIADIAGDPQYQARDIIVPGQVDGVGTVAMPGLVPKLLETPGTVQWYGGRLGTHNDEVYGGLLGLSSVERARLAAEGVI